MVKQLSLGTVSTSIPCISYYPHERRHSPLPHVVNAVLAGPINSLPRLLPAETLEPMEFIALVIRRLEFERVPSLGLLCDL